MPRMLLRRTLSWWLTIGLLVLIAGCIAFLTTRWGFVSDWTAGSRASLAPASRDLLKQLSGPLVVTSYASPGSGLRPTIAAFVARYQRFKPDLRLDFVDPERDPQAMRTAGITIDGEIVISHQGRQQHLAILSDANFSNALARLARGGERIVAFVIGDGERRADGKANADMGQFVRQLEQRGLRAVPLNFAQVVTVPQHTSLVVLASPLVALGKGPVRALLKYLAGGGNLLWLIEPDSRDLGLTPLAHALGIEVLPGMLVDAQSAALGLPDPRVVAVGNYPDHAITHRFTLTTIFPQVVPLAKLSGQDWALAPILGSGPQSWNELQPINNEHPSTIKFDADAGELKGPLDFGFALTRLSPSPNKHKQRVVVIGDGDFLSNSFLGNGGNRALGERVFDWLLGDDQLVKLPARGAPDRHLRLTQTDLNLLAFGLLLVLPLVLLGFAALNAWRRRRH